MILNNKISILFVCMGNMCRSPTAEAVFGRYVDDAGLGKHILIESAGTHVGHSGDPADQRALRAAAKRGYDMSRCRTRPLHSKDFHRFEYLLAMDERNLEVLTRDCPVEHAEKVGLMMSYATPGQPRSIPDPYYGGAQGFERVLDMVEDAAQGLLRHLRQRHPL